MDGLILKINDDFLRNLEKRGLKVKSLKIRYLIRDIGKKGHKYVRYDSLSSYNRVAYSIIGQARYLCSAGDFPVIENLELENKNLRFSNEYQWYNLTERRYVVKRLDFDSFRSESYEKEIFKYDRLMNDLIDKYISDINNAIEVRLSSYVDPCYVDAGYVSPNSEPTDRNTLLFTAPRYTFRASFPTLGIGQNYTVSLVVGGSSPSQIFPTYGFNTVSQVLSWIQNNWGSLGFWTINSNGQLQFVTDQSAQVTLTISTVTIPELRLTSVAYATPSLAGGNPCDKPYLSGPTTVIYPNIQHAWSFRVIAMSGTVNSFNVNLSGDIGGCPNKYVAFCSTGSATISGNTITWNGTLTSPSFVDIQINGDVTLGGKSDVYLGSGGYASHTPPGINTLNNQATVPTDYSIIFTLAPSPNFYTTGTNNTGSTIGHLATYTFQVHTYSNSLNNLLTTGLPMIGGFPNYQIRSTTLVINSISHLSSFTAWSKPLSIFTESLNNTFQKLGYFWCMTTSSGSRPRYVFMTSYYNFSTNSNSLLNSSTNWQNDDNGDGVPNSTNTISPILKAGPSASAYIDFVYPNIGATYLSSPISDVYFPI